MKELKEISPYHDLRSAFFRQHFEQALPYDQYLAQGEPVYAQNWRTQERTVVLSLEERAILGSFTRKMHVLVMSGIWCGDCARQGPILRRIEEACPHISLRFADNKENPDLRDELRIAGAERVPVVVTLSEDFFELSRFGDRHLSVYRRKARSESGPACEVPGLSFKSTAGKSTAGDCTAGEADAKNRDLTGGKRSESETEIREWVEHLERDQLLLQLAPQLRRRYRD